MPTWRATTLATVLVSTMFVSCDAASPPTLDTAAPPTVAITPKQAPPSWQGSAIVRAPQDPVLWIADEDHAVLRRLTLPLDNASTARVIELPGAPAQVLALADKLLVTVRDPGLLIVFAYDAQKFVVERARIELPNDAWGLAVADDGATALVTSAWTRRLSAVDLTTLALRWSVEVAREPRGIAILPGGKTAYVTHLVGPDLTRIDALDSKRPRISRVKLPAAPTRTPRGVALPATLAYAPVLSPDGRWLDVTPRRWSLQAKSGTLELHGAVFRKRLRLARASRLELARASDGTHALWLRVGWRWVRLVGTRPGATGEGLPSISGFAVGVARSVALPIRCHP